MIVENPGPYPAGVSNVDLLELEGRGLVRTKWIRTAEERRASLAVAAGGGDR
jgi:hypothetical protein